MDRPNEHSRNQSATSCMFGVTAVISKLDDQVMMWEMSLSVGLEEMAE